MEEEIIARAFDILRSSDEVRCEALMYDYLTIEAAIRRNKTAGDVFVINDGHVVKVIKG